MGSRCVGKGLVEVAWRNRLALLEAGRRTLGREGQGTLEGHRCLNGRGLELEAISWSTVMKCNET